MRSSHDMPFGTAMLADGGIRFRLWAPAVRQVELLYLAGRWLARAFLA